ncbi:AsnC family transcriptional regulator [Sphingobacterium sp. SG20118]|uniref:AsnC family transcriptional regulator n=1 Tax=Sphingobacterium sp. SG20118 TaxID=3367156 RepID=UPI0037DFBF4E
MLIFALDMTKIEYNLDHVDYKILRLMQDNARINNADIARETQYGPFCDIRAC